MTARFLIPALMVAIASIAATPAPISTRTGVYTDVQASAGAKLYATRCAMCHGRQLEGSYEIPALQGRFIANWSRAPLTNLNDYLARAMPQFAPGSLKPDETAKIIAYLLRENGLPTGSEPLPAGGAGMARIMLEPASPVLATTTAPKPQ